MYFLYKKHYKQGLNNYYYLVLINQATTSQMEPKDNLAHAHEIRVEKHEFMQKYVKEHEFT